MRYTTSRVREWKNTCVECDYSWRSVREGNGDGDLDNWCPQCKSENVVSTPTSDLQ